MCSSDLTLLLEYGHLAISTTAAVVFCFITLRAELSGAVYCNRSCMWVCLFVCVCVYVFVCLWVCLCVCYHDNSKLSASILTKLGLYVKVVTVSSWLNFGRPAPPGRGSAAREFFLAPPYYRASAHLFASL